MTVTEVVTLIAAITAAVVSILGASAAFYAAIKSASTHTLVNGQSHEIQALREDKGHAIGLAEGLAARTDPVDASSSEPTYRVS